MRKYHVTVGAKNPTVVHGKRNQPVASSEFKQWMKKHNTGRVTTSGWKLDENNQRSHVTWCFDHLKHALLFKLTFL